MKKYIIILVVVIAGVLIIWFLVQNQSTINNQINDAGESISVTPTTPGTPTAPPNGATTADAAPITNVANNKIMSATLHTSMGDIAFEFFDSQAPKTVANFIKLAGAGFYEGIKFHRVIKGFMIQGGDPNSKDDSKMDSWGMGGPGYKFADEIDAKSALYKTGYVKGIVAMANSGPNTNGSQFFIMTENYALPPLYTIFGKVSAGQDVVDKIANVATASGDRPVSPVVIKNITLK